LKRGTKIAIGSLVVLALGAGSILGVRVKKQQGTKVRTVKVVRKDLTSIVTANGTIQARTKVDLSSNIMGQITRLDVEEGDTVRKGDLLLVLDQIRYSAAVDARRSGLEALESELARLRESAAQAKRELDRAERQLHDEILPAAQYDFTRSQYDQAMSGVQRVERQVAQARSELAAARDELEKTEIRAPMDGIVTRRNVERGEVVVTGTMNNPGTVLMTVSDMSQVEALLEVDQTDVPSLRTGQPASVLIDAFPDTSFPGTVADIGSSPIRGTSLLGGSATGTDYEVKVALTSHPEGIRPGLTVTADITTGTRKGVLTVPIGALVLRGAESDEVPKPDAEEEARRAAAPGTPESVASRSRDVEGVYLVEAAKVVFRRVTAGIKGELDVEVIDGLEGGEEVVTGPFKALRELRPGSRVVVDNTLGAELEM